MKTLLLCILALVASTPVNAELPPRPDSWVPLGESFTCTVDTEEITGWCRLFRDTDTGYTWLVFFDQTPEVVFIRRGLGGGEYEYRYQRDGEAPGLDI